MHLLPPLTPPTRRPHKNKKKVTPTQPTKRKLLHVKKRKKTYPYTATPSPPPPLNGHTPHTHTHTDCFSDAYTHPLICQNSDLPEMGEGSESQIAKRSERAPLVIIKSVPNIDDSKATTHSLIQKLSEFQK
jgi:hypothetical protein